LKENLTHDATESYLFLCKFQLEMGNLWSSFRLVQILTFLFLGLFWFLNVLYESNKKRNSEYGTGGVSVFFTQIDIIIHHAFHCDRWIIVSRSRQTVRSATVGLGIFFQIEQVEFKITSPFV